MAGESLNKVVRSCVEPNRDYGPAHGLGFRHNVSWGTTFTIQNNVTGVRGKQYERLCAMARAIPMRASDSRGTADQVSFETGRAGKATRIYCVTASLKFAFVTGMHQHFAAYQFLMVSLLGVSRWVLRSALDSTSGFSARANSETNSLGFGPSSH